MRRVPTLTAVFAVVARVTILRAAQDPGPRQRLTAASAVRRRLFMRLPSYRWLQFATAAVVLTTFSCATAAQDYPTRPITMVVPQPAGGPVDTIARILSERMRVSLGQPVIVE